MGSFYVATTGDNTNPGTLASPWRWPSYGIQQIAANDTLHIRAGTYNDNFDTNVHTLPAGTAWSDAPIIRNYLSEVVTMLPTKGGFGEVVNLANGSITYLIFQGLIFDGSQTDGAVSLNGVTYIRMSGCQVTNANGVGINMAVGALPGPPYNTFHEILSCEVDNNGTDSQDHGFYIKTSNNLVKGCHVHHNSAWGIQNFVASQVTDSDDNTIDGNTVHDNSQAAGVFASGILLSTGSNNVAKNNVVYSEPYGIRVHNNTVVDSWVYNNTVDDCTFSGIHISTAFGTPDGTVVRNNNVTNCSTGLDIESGALSTTYGNNNFYGCTTDVTDNGTGTTNEGSNLTSDPVYTDAPNRDYSLTIGSPSQDAGQTLASVDEDFLGVSRPQAAAYDIGAYEVLATVDASSSDGATVGESAGMVIDAPINQVPGAQTFTTAVQTAFSSNISVVCATNNLQTVRLTVSYGTLNVTADPGVVIS